MPQDPAGAHRVHTRLGSGQADLRISDILSIDGLRLAKKGNTTDTAHRGRLLLLVFHFATCDVTDRVTSRDRQ